MYVGLSFQTEEAFFTGTLRITFCITHNRPLHLMATFCSVSDSMLIIALC